MVATTAYWITSIIVTRNCTTTTKSKQSRLFCHRLTVSPRPSLQQLHTVSMNITRNEFAHKLLDILRTCTKKENLNVKVCIVVVSRHFNDNVITKMHPRLKSLLSHSLSVILIFYLLIPHLYFPSLRIEENEFRCSITKNECHLVELNLIVCYSYFSPSLTASLHFPTK